MTGRTGRLPFRWWIAALLFLSTTINYIDRQTLSVLAPDEAKTSEVELEELVNITRRRRENSVKSAIRSLDLAKSVADREM